MIEIKLLFNTAEEAAQALTRMGTSLKTTNAEVAAANAAAATSMVDDASKGADAAPKTRGRARKEAEPAQTPVAAAPVAKVEEPEEDITGGAPVANATIDDVRNVLQEFISKRDMTQARAFILNKFNVDHIKHFKPEQYGAVVAACRAELDVPAVA